MPEGNENYHAGQRESRTLMTETETTLGWRKILRSPEDLQAYAKWRDEVSAGMRRVVEGHLLGRPLRTDQTETPLVGEFMRGVAELLKNPDTVVDDMDFDPRVLNQLKKLQSVAIGEGGVTNVYAVLADPEISFANKEAFFESEISNRLAWLRGQDQMDKEEYLESKLEEVLLSPSDESDEYTPHRVPMEEREGEPDRALALVYPYFGGYHRARTFADYDPSTLTWRRGKTGYSTVDNQHINPERARVYRSSVSGGTRGGIRMPDGWQIDSETIEWLVDEPESFALVKDDDDNVSLSVDGEVGKSYPFQLTEGFGVEVREIPPPTRDVGEVLDQFPIELLTQAEVIMQADIGDGAKMRRLAALIHHHLEYDMDVKWEVVYKADPATYFEKIWQYKKAKCDEANTLAARLTQKFGFHTLYAGGHSAREKTKTGETILHDGNRHGWYYAWNPEDLKWLRLDATPKGDPNVDEDEQKEDLGEGDYGEQEAELLSEEELAGVLQELEKEADEPESPETRFAEKADCTVEEARQVLDLVRNLREKYATVLGEAKKYWQTVVRKNLKERRAYSGPVRQSRGDELEDVVEARLDTRAHESDPSGWDKEIIKKKKEKLFGGFEVYVVADMSMSMADTIDGVRKIDSQRDMVFLLIDSIMASAEATRIAERRLQTPMPVMVSVVVFGTRTEIVLPLTERWTPAEQIRLYRALDAGSGGDTPDDQALALISQQIEDAKSAEKVTAGEYATRSQRRKKGKKGFVEAHRFVIATADGGSNDPSAVKSVNDSLATAGIPVDLFLIASEMDTNLQTLTKSAYQSVSVVPDPQNLARRGLATLTKRLQEAYGVS
jgi:hypothetical protein